MQLALTTDAPGGGRSNTEIVLNFINGAPADAPGAVAIAVFYEGKFQVRGHTTLECSRQ